MSKTFSRAELQEIAKYNRLFLWSILVMLTTRLARLFLGHQNIGLLPYLDGLASIFYLVALYKLVRSLKLSLAWMVLFVISLFVDVLSLLIMLVIQDKAVKTLKSAGVKVGFMGADPDSIK